ncbi:MAG: hypothetical protein ABI644_11345, partial [Arenimonas sp.]
MTANLYKPNAWLALAISLVFAVLLPISASAQMETINAPVSVMSNPKVALPGAPIMLSGKTPATQAGAKVNVLITIEVKPKPAPGKEAKPIQLDVAVDAKGQWALNVKNTVHIGHYTVKVTAPDGKGEATTEFDVVSETAFGEFQKDYAASMDATEITFVSTVDKLLADIPDSAEKQEVIGRYTVIKNKLVDRKKRRPTLIPDPKPVIAALPPEKRAELVTPIFENFEKITVESNSIGDSIRASRFGANACEKLDTVVEALNVTSTLMNFEKNAVNLVINHLTDKVSPALIENHKYGNAGAKFAEGEAVKVWVANLRGYEKLTDGLTGPNGKTIQAGTQSNLGAGVPGLMLDLANYVTKDLYTSMCTRYEGPFTGSLSIEFYTDDNNRIPYWEYTVDIGGKLILSEPKAFSGKPGSTMRGRFDGAAIGYKVWEDALKLNPKLKTQMAFHKLIAPPSVIPLPPDEMGAVFNTAAHPLGFQVGVSAVRKGDQIIVNFDEAAIRDMSPKFNRGLLIYVFIAGMIPAPVYQTLPMQDAHYILSRGMRKDAVLKLSTKGKEQHLTGNFTRKEDTGGILLNWKVDVDICNPACSDSSIQRV